MESYKIFVCDEVFTRTAENPFRALMIACNNGGAKMRYWLCGLEPAAIYRHFSGLKGTNLEFQLLFSGTAKQIIERFSASHGKTYEYDLSKLEELRLSVREDISFWAKHRKDSKTLMERQFDNPGHKQ